MVNDEIPSWVRGMAPWPGTCHHRGNGGVDRASPGDFSVASSPEIYDLAGLFTGQNPSATWLEITFPWDVWFAVLLLSFVSTVCKRLLLVSGREAGAAGKDAAASQA